MLAGLETDVAEYVGDDDSEGVAASDEGGVGRVADAKTEPLCAISLN